MTEPTKYLIGQRVIFNDEEIVHFRGYDIMEDKVVLRCFNHGTFHAKESQIKPLPGGQL